MNGAHITADAKAVYSFIARLYAANDFTFEELAAWLRANVTPDSGSQPTAAPNPCRN
jgi:hypothetical protein